MFRQILVLGVVSFFTDVSSEAIFSVLPLFVTSILGASAQTLGAMEGFADFAASSLDMVSGRLSDRAGKRKAFALLGYSFSSLAKVVLIVASTTGQVFAFRVVERLGKSIRGAPRDALLSELAVQKKRGVVVRSAESLRQVWSNPRPVLATQNIQSDREEQRGVGDHLSGAWVTSSTAQSSSVASSVTSHHDHRRAARLLRF